MGAMSLLEPIMSSSITIPDSFPNLPTTMQKIQRMFAYEEVNITSLVNILQEEPLLSANILKLVNSSYYGLSNGVASINNAVMLLGTTVIRGIAMATVLKKSFPLDLSPYEISIEQFDKICILRVRLLKEWFKGENIDIQLLSSAAFLMESGKIITANELIKHNLSTAFIDLRKEHSTLKAEEILFHTNSYEVASSLFKQWQFEDAFTELLLGLSKPQTEEQRILHVVSIAIGIDAILDDESIEQALRLAQEYDLNSDKLQQSIKIIQQEL